MSKFKDNIINCYHFVPKKKSHVFILTRTIQLSV